MQVPLVLERQEEATPNNLTTTMNTPGVKFHNFLFCRIHNSYSAFMCILYPSDKS